MCMPDIIGIGVNKFTITVNSRCQSPSPETHSGRMSATGHENSYNLIEMKRIRLSKLLVAFYPLMETSVHDCSANHEDLGRRRELYFYHFAQLSFWPQKYTDRQCHRKTIAPMQCTWDSVTRVISSNSIVSIVRKPSQPRNYTMSSSTTETRSMCIFIAIVCIAAERSINIAMVITKYNFSITVFAGNRGWINERSFQEALIRYHWN